MDKPVKDEDISNPTGHSEDCQETPEDEPILQTLEDTTKTLHHTRLQKFGLLTRFMLPLVVTQMVPDVAEQAINRGITSTASDDMIVLLASYGLAFYVSKLFTGVTMEVRHISIVLVHSRQDNIRMMIFSGLIGVVFSGLLLATGLSPLGQLIIRDLHGQSQEVSDTTCTIIIYISPIPLIEAFACYYEGGLIYQKLTGYAGLAKFTDFAMQVVFTAVFLATPTCTEPVLVPVFALYAGLIGRLVLTAGFWHVLVKHKLPLHHPTEKPLTIAKGVWFWLPLVMVRLSQDMTRPVINLFVSKNLSITVSEEAAAKAIAILTAVYPIGRLVFSWLNDLRTIPPTFHKKTDHHEKFSMKVITMYAVFCTSITLLVNLLLFVIPGVGFFIMRRIVGLNNELAEDSVVPLRIFTVICLFIGVRAHLSGVMIMQKKTVYLTPSAVFGLLGQFLVLSTLPQTTRLSGAVLGITCLLLRFIVESGFVVLAALFLKFKLSGRHIAPCLAEKEAIGVESSSKASSDLSESNEFTKFV